MLNPRPLAVSATLLAAISFACATTTEYRTAIPAAIAVTPDSVMLYPLGSQQLGVAVFDGSGLLILGVSVSFTSSDPTTVTVSPAGVVSAVGPLGRATVTVESPPARKSVPVIVVQSAAASVVISPPSLTLLVGDSVRLTATVRDSDGVVIPGAPVAFTSSRSAVATVSASGLVRAVGFGQAVITASSGPASTTVGVQVQPADALSSRIPVSGGTYGIDVSSTGVVYGTVASGSSLVRLSLTPPSLVRSVAVGFTPTGVAFSPDGATAYVTNQASRTLGVVNVATDSQVATVPVNADPFVTLVSPDGSRVIVTGNNDSIFVVNAATRSVVA